MKGLFFLLITALLQTANASDHWDNCTSADGQISLENGQVVKPEPNGEENPVVDKVVKTIKIKQTTETCVLKNSRTRVTSISDLVSYQEMQMHVGDTPPFTVGFLCSQGGSGIPAADSCDEKTAKKTVRYYVK